MNTKKIARGAVATLGAVGMTAGFGAVNSAPAGATITGPQSFQCGLAGVTHSEPSAPSTATAWSVGCGEGVHVQAKLAYKDQGREVLTMPWTTAGVAVQQTAPGGNNVYISRACFRSGNFQGIIQTYEYSTLNGWHVVAGCSF